MANQRRALLGDVFRKAAMPRERNGDLAGEQQADPPPEPNGELSGDLADDLAGRGNTGTVKPRATRQRRQSVPVDDGEKAKGRNLKIPDSVFRRLELEALRRGTDNSKLATRLLHSALPKDIEMSFVVGGKKATTGDDEKTPAADD
jgi:hypothetical protein